MVASTPTRTSAAQNRINSDFEVTYIVRVLSLFSGPLKWILGDISNIGTVNTLLPVQATFLNKFPNFKIVQDWTNKVQNNTMANKSSFNW